MTDLVTLGIAVDSRQVAQAGTQLERMARSANEAEREAAKLGRTMMAAGKPADDFARHADAAARASGNFSQGAQQVIAQLRQEALMVGATARQRAQFAAIQRAGVAVHTAEAHAIARMSGSLFDLQQRQEMAMRSAGRFGNTMREIGQSMIFTGTAAGTAISVISRFGPVGLTIGAAMGAAALAMATMTREAERLADKSGKIVDFAQSTGFTAEQFQALTQQATQVGLKAETVGTALERFAANVALLKDGTGELLPLLRQVDPALVRQMQGARTTAEAWDILWKALQRVGVEERNLITRGALGRNLGISRLGLATAEAGGIDKLVKQIGEQNVLMTQQVELWDRLRDEAALYADRTRDKIASIFAADVLSAQRDYFQAWESFVDSVNSGKWSQAFDRMIMMGRSTLSFLSGGLIAPPSAAGPNAVGGSIPGQAAAPHRFFGEAFANPLQPPSTPLPRTATQLAEEGRARMQFLGGAATATQIYNQRVLEINASIEKNKELEGLRGQAIGEATQAMKEATIQARITLGVATEEQMVQAARLRTVREAARNNLSFAETQRAVAIATKEAKEQFEQLQIRTAEFPGLKRLELDAANVKRQLDDFSVSTLNNMSSALVDFAMGTETAGEAFKRFADGMIRALLEMIIRMTILQPIAAALQSTLNPLAGLVGGFAGGGATTVGTGHSGAILGAPGGSQRQVNPLLFLGAARHHRGTSFLGSNEVPFIGMRGEEVGWPSQLAAKYGSGRSPNFNLVINNNAGVDVRASRPQRNQSGGFDIQVLIDRATAKNVMTPGSETESSLRLSNTLVRR